MTTQFCSGDVSFDSSLRCNAQSTPENLDQWDGEWLIACLRPNHTAQTARELYFANVRTFVPIGERETKRAGRKVIVKTNLLPGYLPCCVASVEQESFLFNHRHIFRRQGVMRIGENRRARFVQQLLQWEIMLRTRKAVEAAGLKIGIRVAIRSGWFMGFEGIVDRIGSAVIHLNIDYLGRSIPLEIDAAQIEPV